MDYMKLGNIMQRTLRPSLSVYVFDFILKVQQYSLCRISYVIPPAALLALRRIHS